MNYCGIDLGGMSSYAFVTDEHGRKLWSGPVETTKPGLMQLVQRFCSEGLAIAVEAGNQTAWVYEELVLHGAKVTVVNPNQVKLIAESRRKTDKVDAKILRELLRVGGLPRPVHMPTAGARELRGLLVARRQLITARVKLCNVVRGMLRQTGVRLAARELSSKAGWQRLLHVGFEHDHLLDIVTAYYDSFLASCGRAVSAPSMGPSVARGVGNYEPSGCRSPTSSPATEAGPHNHFAVGLTAWQVNAARRPLW